MDQYLIFSASPFPWKIQLAYFFFDPPDVDLRLRTSADKDKAEQTIGSAPTSPLSPLLRSGDPFLQSADFKYCLVKGDTH